jgi:hypothetical protein
MNCAQRTRADRRPQSRSRRSGPPRSARFEAYPARIAVGSGERRRVDHEAVLDIGFAHPLVRFIDLLHRNDLARRDRVRRAELEPVLRFGKAHLRSIATDAAHAIRPDAVLDTHKWLGVGFDLSPGRPRMSGRPR